MKRILIAAFLIFSSSEVFAAACTNPVGVKDGAGTSMNFNTTVDGSSNCTSNVIPGAVLTTLSGWTSATALNTTQTIMSANGGAPAILLQLDQTSTLTVGATTIEGTYDGTNWVSIPVAQLLNPNTFAPLTNPYTLVASTNQPFLILTQGYQGVRIKLSTAITGSATVTPFVALLSTNPVMGALLNPLAAGSAIIGKVGVDQTTPGTTNGVAIVGVNAATALAGNGATGTGSARVTLSNDNTAIANWGQGATGATAPTGAAFQGIRGQNAEQTAVTNGQLVGMAADLVGKPIIMPYANTENFVSGSTSAMTATTSTSVIASAGGSLRNYVTACTFSNSHATVGTMILLQDGSGGATLWQAPAAAVFGGAHVIFPTPLKTTAATALFTVNVTTGANTFVSCTGYKGL